ncbi:MAG: YtxH domain-containing protein [bacterium]|nr:YtxH domain-containing protein [bacterium]
MSKKKKGFGKFLVGATLGVGLGMLFTKTNGEENRKQLKAKVNDLISKAKDIDPSELKLNIETKVNDIMAEISELDKEKALKIAKKKAEEIKNKSEKLVEYVVEKGNPVLEKSADIVREKAILVTKQILSKLEKEEK